MSAVASQRRTPQAKAHCGMSNKKMKAKRLFSNNQNLGDSFGGV